MKKIIIATHYKMADGLKDTLNFITGYNDVINLSAYVEHENIEDDIKKIFKEIKSDDHVYIFTDILQGSVTQKFFPYLNDNIRLITGTNLPLLMMICLDTKDNLSKEEINNFISEAQNSIVQVNPGSDNNDDEDE